MEHLFDHNWEIEPAGGATGEAFFAHSKEQKLFLKRNSSPFLAVLSAEGIVPKLVWTKRLENGDVITAQHWIHGRVLEAADMKKEEVAKLLRKIHQSKALLTMLKRLGKTPLNPEKMLMELILRLSPDLQASPVVQESLAYLKAEVKYISHSEYVVCHSDVNHHNWMLSAENELYLIDWDGALIGDPAIDLGSLLYWYIPEAKWGEWLEQYGIPLTDHLKLRMKWYVIAQTLQTIQWLKNKKNLDEADYWLRYLNAVL
ncbi:MAG TPA: phosphotransferase family protein [Bacillus sp. (in: firmicutes)]|uniref:phosphotransferase n=1 Tax=Bacillus litorisediminis TaxID=2922713 RepID=UPI001FAC6CFC|nr:phosphotransferase family protein [Bacillus litorisediminis]HWO75741.1 phosphotransferase family protein [Bacillus sp. (in: firmicutes)]